MPGEVSLLQVSCCTGRGVAPAAAPFVLCALLLWPAAETRAESDLLLPLPQAMGAVDVDTYDEAGEVRVGPGFIQFETLDDDTVEFVGASGIEDAENTIIKALFERTPDGAQLRPLFQESRSFDAAGAPLGVMTIDHREGTGTCHPTGSEPQSVDLPKADRVANVILAQALVPLAATGKGEAPFQILICRPTVRVVSAVARVQESAAWNQSSLVEIRTGADLGPVLNKLLGPWLPSVSLWFDGGQPAWLGHRVPLFAKGPTVTVLRADVAASVARAIRP